MDFSFFTDVIAAIPVDFIYSNLILQDVTKMTSQARIMSKANRLFKMWVLRSYINALVIQFKEHYMKLCYVKCVFYLTVFVYLSTTVMYVFKDEIIHAENNTFLETFYLILQKATGNNNF